jgi:hypothetical protein
MDKPSDWDVPRQQLLGQIRRPVRDGHVPIAHRRRPKHPTAGFLPRIRHASWPSWIGGREATADVVAPRGSRLPFVWRRAWVNKGPCRTSGFAVWAAVATWAVSPRQGHVPGICGSAYRRHPDRERPLFRDSLTALLLAHRPLLAHRCAPRSGGSQTAGPRVRRLGLVRGSNCRRSPRVLRLRIRLGKLEA